MKSVNAVELRQSLGRVCASLQRGGPPVLLAKGRKPVAVLISLQDFHERFAERAAAEARRALLQEIDALARPAADTTPAAEILRQERARAG